MLFLPFDAFGAYNKGVQQAEAENWADIFNTEKAARAKRENAAEAALFDSTIAATNAKNNAAAGVAPLTLLDAQNKSALAGAAFPGALAAAQSGSAQAVNFAEQLAPQIPTLNGSRVQNVVLGAQNQATGQTRAAADSLWANLAPSLAAMQTVQGNEGPIAAALGRVLPGAQVAWVADPQNPGTGKYMVQHPTTGTLSLTDVGGMFGGMNRGYFTTDRGGNQVFHPDATPRAAAGGKGAAAKTVVTPEQANSALGVGAPVSPQNTPQATAVPGAVATNNAAADWSRVWSSDGQNAAVTPLDPTPEQQVQARINAMPAEALAALHERLRQAGAETDPDPAIRALYQDVGGRIGRGGNIVMNALMSAGPAISSTIDDVTTRLTGNHDAYVRAQQARRLALYQGLLGM